MSNDIVFSVVIPTYNRGHVLSRAINSVIEQSFTNFELLIIDDGSIDNTKEIVSEINDSRIVYFRQDNKGAPNARNTGIEIAKGFYIAFLDSDDCFYPYHLENALPVLASNSNVCTYTKVLVDRGNNITFLKPPRAYDSNEDISEYYLCDRGFVPTSTLIVPSGLAIKVKYDEESRSGNDMDFSIRLIHAGGKLVMLEKPGAICYDRKVEDRLSSLNNIKERLAWLERNREVITDKAYYGEQGWRIAKQYSQNGNIWLAIKLYFKALSKRCYKPKLAIVIILQIIMSPQTYRKFADYLARIGVQP